MIEETIRGWARSHPLSSGDDLSGFVMDCEVYLEAQDAFLRADVKSTEDSLSMVNAAITIDASVSSLQSVVDAFKAAWAEIAYLEFQAISIHWYEEATVFRFITGN